MKHLQDVHMSYVSHLTHAWQLSFILLVPDSCHGFGRARSATKSAKLDAPFIYLITDLSSFWPSSPAMVSTHKAKRSVATLAARWHRWCHGLCHVDRHCSLLGNPNYSLAGIPAIGQSQE